MITALTLADDTRGISTAVKPNSLIAFQGLAIEPSVRQITQSRVAAHGDEDVSKYFGATSVSLTLLLPTGDRATLDDLAQYMHPSYRPHLTITDDGWATPRRVVLSPRNAGKPITTGQGQQRAVLLQWAGPDGVLLEDSATELIAPAYIASSGGVVMTSAGLALSSAGLAVSPGDTGTPQTAAVGNVAVPWTAKLYGPANQPRLYNDTAGHGVIFTSAVVLAAGDYIDIDSQARTAYLNSDPAQPQPLDWVDSYWWQMVPGNNSIRYDPQYASAGAEAVVTYRSAWIP